jgi:bile acid:Na+ symporter, BASS family
LNADLYPLSGMLARSQSAYAPSDGGKGLMQEASDITLQVFVISTMLALGLRIPLQEMTRGLRDLGSLLPGAALNLLVIPALGVLVANVFDLSPALRVGFVLIAMSPGAPLALKLVEFANGDMAFSVALVVILQLAGLVSVPLLADLFLSSTVEIDYPQVIGSILLLQLVPLVIGFSLMRIRRAESSLWTRAVSVVSDASFALLVVLVVIDDLPEVARILEPSVVAAVLTLLAASFAAGLALGGPVTSGRRSLAIVSAGRKGGLALILAAASFDREPAIVIMIVAYSLIELVLLTGVAQWWRRRPPVWKVDPHQEVV